MRKRTVANLTGSISEEQALMLRRVLKGEALVAPRDAFEVTGSLPHGHVQALLTAMKRLGIESLLASRPSRERDIVTALIASRVLNPKSKLATTRAWNDTTLAAELGVSDVDEHAVYRAMGWLVSRQVRIEGKLAARHLSDGARVMFDLSSKYVEGEKRRLAAFGYDRVRAHLFICMLAYYVRWHMEAAWASLSFKDEDGNEDRDPVAPAVRSAAATDKAQTSTLVDGAPARTFKGLLGHLGTITRYTCRHPQTGITFPMTTSPNEAQQKALDLLGSINV